MFSLAADPIMFARGFPRDTFGPAQGRHGAARTTNNQRAYFEGQVG
jgi:hypothetical protein